MRMPLIYALCTHHRVVGEETKPVLIEKKSVSLDLRSATVEGGFRRKLFNLHGGGGGG